MSVFGNKGNLPDLDISDQELSALSGLGKTSTDGSHSFNPYKKIDKKYLDLNVSTEEDDWFYLTEDDKPRARHAHIFNVVGSSTLAGGILGVGASMRQLNEKKYLGLSTLRHPVKRSEMITNLVNNCRNMSGKFGTFAFTTAICWALLDQNKVLSGYYSGPLHKDAGAAIGGAMFAIPGVLSDDMKRSHQMLFRMQQDDISKKIARPRGVVSYITQMNRRVHYFAYDKYVHEAEAPRIPRWFNTFTGLGRIGLLAGTAFGITNLINNFNKSNIKIVRDIKRWKW